MNNLQDILYFMLKCLRINIRIKYKIFRKLFRLRLYYIKTFRLIDNFILILLYTEKLEKIIVCKKNHTIPLKK